MAVSDAAATGDHPPVVPVAEHRTRPNNLPIIEGGNQITFIYQPPREVLIRMALPFVGQIQARRSARLFPVSVGSAAKSHRLV